MYMQSRGDLAPFLRFFPVPLNSTCSVELIIPLGSPFNWDAFLPDVLFGGFAAGSFAFLTLGTLDHFLSSAPFVRGATLVTSLTSHLRVRISSLFYLLCETLTFEMQSRGDLTPGSSLVLRGGNCFWLRYKDINRNI